MCALAILPINRSQDHGTEHLLSNDEIRELVSPFRKRTGGVVSALREILETEGYVDPSRFPIVADVFNLSVAEVRGITSFYEDFRTTHPPRTILRVCQAEACQALGSRRLLSSIERRIASTRRSKARSVEAIPVYCLGLCSIGPAMLINDRLLGRAKLADLEDVL